MSLAGWSVMVGATVLALSLRPTCWTVRNVSLWTPRPKWLSVPLRTSLAAFHGTLLTRRKARHTELLKSARRALRLRLCLARFSDSPPCLVVGHEDLP